MSKQHFVQRGTNGCHRSPLCRRSTRADAKVKPGGKGTRHAFVLVPVHCLFGSRALQGQTKKITDVSAPGVRPCLCVHLPSFLVLLCAVTFGSCRDRRCQISEGLMARKCQCFDTVGQAGPEGAHFGMLLGMKRPDFDTRPQPDQRHKNLGFVRVRNCQLCDRQLWLGPKVLKFGRYEASKLPIC